MTTNVFDELNGVMATDSRWSIQHGSYIIYLDDTGYEKILIWNGYAIMFAGNGGRIQQWKDWIMSNPKDASEQPPVEGICVCIVDMVAKKVKSSVKQIVLAEGGYFAGSGQLYAVPCWMKNRLAQLAVETAKSNDKLSGGDVKFYNFVSGENNLNVNFPTGNMTIQMVTAALLKRGLVMQTTKGAHGVPFAEAANDNPELQQIVEKVANGELTASAPSEGMYSQWTTEEKASLNNALGDMFGWKK